MHKIKALYNALLDRLLGHKYYRIVYQFSGLLALSRKFQTKDEAESYLHNSYFLVHHTHNPKIISFRSHSVLSYRDDYKKITGKELQY